MKPHKEPNQGEGDKASARKYNRAAESFVAEGKVGAAAREAEDFVEREPDEAARAEELAKRGPGGAKVSLDDLIAKGRSVVERVAETVKPYVDRARAKLARK